MSAYIQYILLGIMLAAPIGPSSLAVIQNGLRGGFWRAWRTGIGVTLADASMLLVVYFGLAGLMNAAWAKTLIWSLGALVLLYLGSQSLRQARMHWLSGSAPDELLDETHALSPDPTEPSAEKKDHNPFLAGYLVNISNPVALVFWAGIYGSLIGASAGARDRALLSGAAILGGILIWHTTTSLLSHLGRRLLKARGMALVSAVAGLALILFGLRFAWNALGALLR